MKLRTKIVIVFITSIIISVIVFLVAFAVLASSVYSSSYSDYRMNSIAYSIIKELKQKNAFSEGTAAPIMIKWMQNYRGLELELIAENDEIIYSTSGKSGKYGMNQIVGLISRDSINKEDRMAIGRAVFVGNEIKAYLVLTVNRQDYLPPMVTAYRSGIVLFLFAFFGGLGITIIVSSIIAMLLMNRTSKRFNKLYKGIGSFELGNLKVKVQDNSKDEIGQLAQIFNNMAEKLRIQVKNQQAYQDERQKMMSNISHDLRTPLTSILGYAESLENGVYENEEERVRFISIIKKNAIYMEKLLGEVLDLSRLESSGFKLSMRQTDLAELSREVLIEFIPMLQEQTIELQADIPEQAVVLMIDKDRIARVLRNLIDNSIKYGSQGKYIRYALQEETAGVRILVQDRGQGIEKEQLGKIFNRFYRGDKARNSKDGGMGLGLAITNEIIKKHDGRIEVESEAGKGTTFKIWLPRENSSI